MSFSMNYPFSNETEKILNDTFLGTNNSSVTSLQQFQQTNNNYNNFNAFNTTIPLSSALEDAAGSSSSFVNGVDYQISTMTTNFNSLHNNYFQTAAATAGGGIFNNMSSQNFITNITNFLLDTTVEAILMNAGADTQIITPSLSASSSSSSSFLSSGNFTSAINSFQISNSNTINRTIFNDLSSLNFNNNSINSSLDDSMVRLEHAPQLSKSALIRCIVLSAMAIVSLLGNTATMWNIYKTRMTKRPSRHNWSAIYSLIFHLSIADVLVTGFCIIGEAAWCYTVQWLASEFVCKSVKFFQMFSLYLSTYVLVLIGVDRWIAVKYPMKSLNMAKRCYRLLGGAYVLSFVLSIPQFFIFRVARGPFIEDFYQCVTHGFYTAEWQEQLYTTFTLFFTFIIPLCILIVTYLSTFRTISGSEKMFQGSKLAVYTSKPATQTNRQRLIHKAKMKSLRISVVIIVAFLICWTPYNVMMIIFMFLNPDKRLGEDLQSGIFFFGMSNSLVNPLIYGAFHLCPLKRNNSQYAHYSLTRDNSHSYQRSPSLLTATTQIDSSGRQHTFKNRTSYYQRNGSMIRRPVPDQFDLTNSSLSKKLQQSTIAIGCPNDDPSTLIHLNSNNSSNNNSVANSQREYLLRQTSFNGNHIKTINNSGNSQMTMGYSSSSSSSNHPNSNGRIFNDLTKKLKNNNSNISNV